MRLTSLLLLCAPPLVQAVVKGISWFGLETQNADLMCLWAHDLHWNLQKIQDLGFSHIRLPFSLEYIEKGAWGTMDAFFHAVEGYNLSVVLDFHRLESTHQSEKPYTDQITFDRFLQGWETILARYHSSPKLTGVDIFNEYQSQDYQEWNNLARQIVDYIESRFPARFNYLVGGTNWGGSIHFVNLTDLSFSAERVSYTVRKYWFSDKEPFERAWDWSIGPHKLVAQVGEWGYQSSQPLQVDWANRFIAWLLKNGVRDSFFWTWSYNGGDTDGILLSDCESIDQAKTDLLQRYWAG
jgi:aryl-phospho-beta-D-glucosidase BglC (GH1 family)